MRKVCVAFVVLSVLATAAWSSAQREAPAAAAALAMDKIVYLSADRHDSDQSVRDAWAAQFERITGVPIVLKTVSSKSANDAMMAQFMAGEFPDVMKFGGDRVDTLARQEFVVPLNPFIEASAGMKELYGMFPSSFAAHSVGDTVYGIPAVTGAKRSLWIRTDVLDKLGIGMPTTLDEFVAMLKKMRDQVPTPDGTKMFPFISKTYHHGYIAGIANYFDVSPDPAIRRPGKGFREGWDSPQFRDYAELMKMMYDEGLMDPDHVLPQKASGTRSKFFAGKGATLMMHSHSYQQLVTELRKNWPEAEVAMLPPIVNPKGGVMGMAIIPGYRPFAIMTAAANYQFVWDEFIETVILNPKGVMLQYRGVEGVQYRIEGDMMVDNSDVSGENLGLRSPLNPKITFPYKLAAISQIGLEKEMEMDRWMGEYGDYVAFVEPTADVPDYSLIAGDMKDRKQELFWKYVLGEHTFQEMMASFDVYKKEIGWDAILEQIKATH